MDASCDMKREAKISMLKNLRKLMQKKMVEGMREKPDLLSMADKGDEEGEDENEIEISLGAPEIEEDAVDLKEEMRKYFKGEGEKKKPLKTKVMIASSSMGIPSSVKKAMGKSFAKA